MRCRREPWAGVPGLPPGSTSGRLRGAENPSYPCHRAAKSAPSSAPRGRPDVDPGGSPGTPGADAIAVPGT
ncbi:hypothetical protein FRUB_06788 [Fimbriiglobus ruber]|uniref:Uncharacterized protein n=1 Tax=Fimbriiglobus ruber TaxID=1908690 RepID=A0A225DGL8_9BACT|nr:hypothetical protein FRUB_06788 [Fimbriiglobus ruber]